MADVKEKAKAVKNAMMVATAPGFYKGRRISEGTVFSFTGRPGRWMVPAKDAPVKGKDKAEEEKTPDTLSELGKTGGGLV